MTEPCFQAGQFIAEKQRATILAIGYTNTGRVSFQVHPAAIKYLPLFALCQIRTDIWRLFSTEMVNSQRSLRVPARESIRTQSFRIHYTRVRAKHCETLTLTRDSTISIILIKLETTCNTEYRHFYNNLCTRHLAFLKIMTRKCDFKQIRERTYDARDEARV